MVYQILCQAHLNEVGSKQNWETMTLQISAILDLLLLIFNKGPHEKDGNDILFG